MAKEKHGRRAGRLAKRTAKKDNAGPRAVDEAIVVAGEARLPLAAARAALDQATKVIRSLRRKRERNAWAIGRRLLQVAELGLHHARGFTTLEAYAEELLDLSRSTAFQYMRVAHAFGERMVSEHGVEKLDRALAYIAATPADETPADIPELRVPVHADDGTIHTKSFPDVTAIDLRVATQRERQRNRRRTAPRELDRAQATQALAVANRALDRAVGRKAAPGAIVRVRTDGGTTLIDVRGVPLARAAAAFQAIAKALE